MKEHGDVKEGLQGIESRHWRRVGLYQALLSYESRAEAYSVPSVSRDQSTTVGARQHQPWCRPQRRPVRLACSDATDESRPLFSPDAHARPVKRETFQRSTREEESLEALVGQLSWREWLKVTASMKDECLGRTDNRCCDVCVKESNDTEDVAMLKECLQMLMLVQGERDQSKVEEETPNTHN